MKRKTKSLIKGKKLKIANINANQIAQIRNDLQLNLCYRLDYVLLKLLVLF